LNRPTFQLPKITFFALNISNQSQKPTLPLPFDSQTRFMPMKTALFNETNLKSVGNARKQGKFEVCWLNH
jgi:hypothetical protein